MVRAIGSYPIGHKFESHRRYHCKQTEISLNIDGPLVKRLRHHPFTVVTWVRVPYGSPAKSTGNVLCFFAVPVTGNTTNPSGSREAIYCRRSPRGPFGVSEIPVRDTYFTSARHSAINYFFTFFANRQLPYILLWQ